MFKKKWLLFVCVYVIIREEIENTKVEKCKRKKTDMKTNKTINKIRDVVCACIVFDLK